MRSHKLRKQTCYITQGMHVMYQQDGLFIMFIHIFFSHKLKCVWRVANTCILLCFSPVMKFVNLCRREISSMCVVNVYIVETYSELVQIIQQVYSSYYVNLWEIPIWSLFFFFLLIIFFICWRHVFNTCIYCRLEYICLVHKLKCALHR